MAFSNDRWRLFRDVGPWRAWYYEASGDTVTATGYFAEKWQDLRVNDLLYVETTSDVPQYRVSAVGPQSVTITSYGSGGGGGLNDGDYGDVTVGGSGTTMAINAGAVDLAMLSTDFTTAGKALLDDADAAAQRTTLGLGTIATQAASSVTITGGSVTGITDITAADGGTGRSSHTAYAVICGGTTTTAAQQSIASVGTAGQVLTSNGAGALPTFQNASGGTADDWDIVSTSNPSSPYAPSGLTGNTVIKITALAGNLTLNVPTGTFGSSKRFYVQYLITASGGARTITLGSGMSLGFGVAVNLVIASGDTLILTFYTDDNGTSFTYDGDFDISKLSTKSTPVSGDFLLGMDSAASNALKKFAVLLAASIGTTNTGTDTAAFLTADGLAGAYAGTKAVSLPLSALDTDNLATGDGQAWFTVPACMNGMNLVGIVGTVATAGSGGTLPTFNIRRVRSGSAVDMLSTALTIDLTETSSITAATAAVINTSNDDVQTGDLIKLDIDAVGSTPAKGGSVALEFRLP